MTNITNLHDFELEFSKLGRHYKTKDVDSLNKTLIKNLVDVQFLKDIILDKQQYHRTYFQVSLGLIKDINEQFRFIEDNFHLLNDWWHVDQLTQFISKELNVEYAYKKAKEYIHHSNLFARRWAYVMFMPTLVKTKEAFDKIIDLFKDDHDYYVVMAEAWLISYLGIYHPDKTLEYLKNKPLEYNIVGKAIQKVCDSYRIDDEYKEKFKNIRKIYKTDN